MKYAFGAINSSFDIRDYSIVTANNVPEKFYCPIQVPVKNQGQYSTCVAHAAASAVEYHYKKITGKYRKFSTEFIYGIRDIGYYVGEGMSIRDALKTLLQYGDVFEVDCPGNNHVQQSINNVHSRESELKVLAYPHRISAYYKCNGTHKIKSALLAHGPVLVSIDVHEKYRFVDDVYDDNSSKRIGKHCVLIIGYDEKGWLIQNSWGKYHAGDGKFYMPYSYKFNEAWGLADSIDDTTVNVIKIKPRSFILDKIYKIYNKLINLFLNLKKN